MLSWLKPDPQKKLRKQYHEKLEAAMHAQRNGDIKSYSMLSKEADALWQQINGHSKEEHEASKVH